MNLIQRKHCISCRGELLEVERFLDFPVFMGTTKQSQEEDVKVDMIFSQCKECNIIQLAELVPLDILYKDAHNNSIGKVWQEHHLEFANFIKRYASGNVVEVGGAHLTLANHLIESENISTVTVFDANLSVYDNTPKDGVFLKEQFFDSNSVINKPSAIIHSHVIEHLYDPLVEIKNMADLLSDGEYMFISAPIIDEMMNDGFTNAMNLEHTYGLSKCLLRRIMRYANLKIIEEKEFNKHCVFIVATKTSNTVKQINYKQDPSYFYNFISNHKFEVDKIKKDLLGPKSDTFIFGAHIFTQFLLNFGLEESSFSCVLDNDKRKQKNRLYGTGLFVRSPEVLRSINKPTVVLKAGQYTEEIMTDIINNINPNTRFIL